MAVATLIAPCQGYCRGNLAPSFFHRTPVIDPLVPVVLGHHLGYARITPVKVLLKLLRSFYGQLTYGYSRLVGRDHVTHNHAEGLVRSKTDQGLHSRQLILLLPNEGPLVEDECRPRRVPGVVHSPPECNARASINIELPEGTVNASNLPLARFS